MSVEDLQRAREIAQINPAHSAEKSTLAQLRAAISQEKAAIAQEKAALAQEKAAVAQERTALMQEKLAQQHLNILEMDATPKVSQNDNNHDGDEHTLMSL